MGFCKLYARNSAWFCSLLYFEGILIDVWIMLENWMSHFWATALILFFCYSLLSFRLPQRILILHINSEALPITYSVCCVFVEVADNSTTHNTLLFCTRRKAANHLMPSLCLNRTWKDIVYKFTTINSRVQKGTQMKNCDENSSFWLHGFM